MEATPFPPPAAAGNSPSFSPTEKEPPAPAPTPLTVPALPLSSTVNYEGEDLEESLEDSVDASSPPQKAPKPSSTSSPVAKKTPQPSSLTPNQDLDEVPDDDGIIMTDRSEGLGGRIYQADGSYLTTTDKVGAEVRKLSQHNITSPGQVDDVEDDLEGDDDDEDYEDFEDDDGVALP